MKKVITMIFISFVLMTAGWNVFGFTADISKESFMIDINQFFPSFGTTDKIANSSSE